MVKRLGGLVIFLIVCYSINAADWHLIEARISEDLSGVYFTENDRGITVSKRGTIYNLQLTDKGWTYKTNSIDKPLNGIYFHENGKDGIIYGDRGAFLRTNDSGANWILDSLNADFVLSDLAFFNRDVGILIGTDQKKGQGMRGVAYKTTDGGETWVPLRINGNRFNAVNISASGTITIVGQGVIHFSNDSGTTWEKNNMPSQGYAQAIDFRDNRGIMVGKGGLLALSKDNGDTWERHLALNEKVTFFDLLMLDKQRIYIIGSMAEILYSEDGGYNWIPEPSSAIYDLYDIYQAGKKIYVCGKRGALVYTEIDD